MNIFNKNIRNLACLLIVAFSLMANTAQAQLEASIKMTTEADCDNVSVTFYLVHNDPNVLFSDSGTDYYGIFGNVAFVYDGANLSNPVLTDNFLFGNPFMLPLIDPAGPALVVDFESGVFFEHQYMAPVELFTVTFDHNNSQECASFFMLDYGQRTDIFDSGTSTAAILNTLEKDHECIPLCP